ncbi:hypothetical protein [Dermatobacter hominis]|uniref:hypothetical protein n=1 Tax=Dermatobacter hominis TaxID=2884263 RepID=UPI001D0F8F96|nr:hypothetical protein [Dermatobacter hominis]UDY34025.1 hypothetical protein LH044_11785 [Dermatobacter hominis]
MSDPDVEAVLAGTASYDSLRDDQQAIVRAAWDERIEARLATIDLIAEFEALGQSYVVLDDDGRVVKHRPGQAPVVISQPDNKLLLEQLTRAAGQAHGRMVDDAASDDECAAARQELFELTRRITDVQFGEAMRNLAER